MFFFEPHADITKNVSHPSHPSLDFVPSVTSFMDLNLVIIPYPAFRGLMLRYGSWGVSTI